MSVDEAGFERLMAEQRERARTAQRAGESGPGELEAFQRDTAALETTFVGYERLEVYTMVRAARVLPDGRVALKLEESPFYAEGGGQVADTGWIHTDSGKLDVVDVVRFENDQVIVGRPTEGSVVEGERAKAMVNAVRRHQTACNHTATHLLHNALRIVLGDEVRQAGSLVTPDRLRFDYKTRRAPTAGRAAPDRGPGQPAHRREPPGAALRHHPRVRRRDRRAGVLRREVRRVRARARDRRVQPRAVWRHARVVDLADRALQDHRQHLGRRQYTARRSDHVGRRDRVLPWPRGSRGRPRRRARRARPTASPARCAAASPRSSELRQTASVGRQRRAPGARRQAPRRGPRGGRRDARRRRGRRPADPTSCSRWPTRSARRAPTRRSPCWPASTAASPWWSPRATPSWGADCAPTRSWPP